MTSLKPPWILIHDYVAQCDALKEDALKLLSVRALKCNEALQTMKIEEDFHHSTLKRILLPKKERNRQKNKPGEWGQENVLL